MDNIKEMTAPNVSAATDTEQSSQKNYNDIIAQNDSDFNSTRNYLWEIQRMMNPYYLKTVSMNELYDTVFQSRPPLIDGLLYPGTYLFVGAPKLGNQRISHLLV